MKITNWGKYPQVEAAVQPYRPGFVFGDEGGWIPRGMGRCYGDSALAARIVSSDRMNRFLAFDPATGQLTCEAGVTFADIIDVFLPRGWFPPVTPGTKFVSMGGALASDVHGKNHHKEGSFADHVLSFDLLTADGSVRRCSRDTHPALFQATAGGMGLTGLILSLTLQLRPVESSAIRMASIKARNLAEILDLFDASGEATYTVAWIDCLSRGNSLGRSILMQGEHATRDELPADRQATPFRPARRGSLTVPFDLPPFVLNNTSIRLFNQLYYHKQRARTVQRLVEYDPFFYPLDVIHHWNRIYGRRGFTQYQLVVPRAAGQQALPHILREIVGAGFGSFLSVLKLFGPQGSGLLSFPMEGYTLTLDFPITRRLFPFLDHLDHLVADYGGRVYLTKDVRLPAAMMARMYPRLPEFRAVLAQLDPDRRVRSLQSERLALHPRKLAEVL
ncbi:MAG: FAD-binding oxidoreductase [Bacteroidia bacterium]